ncbi:hypothetical protein LWI29_017605 [Acer saccharum]|uniref:Retrotransposon gag domain-containing protein n=1 Tax=Acer saccharum TaxID=4024 RepID=A0AA39VZS7_ACESA|nr:hypothetical protein LWI29_017605 [Acer saccharum]
MAGDGDGSDSRYSQGVPSNELEDDTALNTADATLTTANQSAALAGIQRLPTANEEIAQRLRASLQQLISDAARQGIDLSVTEGLMSPHELSAPSQQTARLRSAVVIPTPDAPPKARQDPTGRPEMLSERVARRNRVAGDRDRPRRRGHRRDRSSSEESEQNHHRKRQRGTVRLHGLNRDHRELNPEERGQKLTISQNFNASGEPEGDRDILIQSLTREVQNNRRQMDALVRRYGRNELSDDESGSPFTNGVLRMPFPERFRMPHIELLRRIQTQKSMSGGSRWFGRLPAASISSFGELSKAFSRQFLGNVHRKKSVAHLSQLKQGKDESLKKYLGRFGQEVSEIGSANDEAIIAAFINNL